MKTLTNWSDFTQKLILISFDRLGLSIAGLSCIRLKLPFFRRKIFVLRYYDDCYIVYYRELPIVILTNSLIMNNENMDVIKKWIYYKFLSVWLL